MGSSFLEESLAAVKAESLPATQKRLEHRLAFRNGGHQIITTQLRVVHYRFVRIGLAIPPRLAH